MCGIAGIVGGDPLERVPRGRAMLDLLAHRGPDAQTDVETGEAWLGCTRLAIRGGIAGAQPLQTHRGHLVFNGEIYNTSELVKDLAWHGVTVSGDSDTEVVGALLDIYGIKAVDRLNGMYAIAWYDGASVWLARDPAGVKPLYYQHTGSELSFASEMRPLLGSAPAACADAISRWMLFHVAYGYETFFEGIRRVPPGGVMVFTQVDGFLRTVRTRDPAMAFSTPNPALTPERLGKVLGRAIHDARHTDSDERCGVAFSGGVDSSLVAAGLPKNTIAYHGRVDAPGCDESPHARAAAKELGLDLVEVEITAEDCWRALPDVVRALEEPGAGPGSVAQWLVAKRAAEDVRILYSGCGGDELFGGYARLAALLSDDGVPPAHLANYLPLFERVSGLAPADRALAVLDRRTPGLFRPEFVAAHPAPTEAFLEAFGAGGLETHAAATEAELRLTLPALLHIEDRVGMAFGLESRVPLLDRRLLRSAMRLPETARVGPGGELKALLKAAAAPMLPPSVRARRDKMGFPLPLTDWLCGPWNAGAREILLDRRTKERGILDPVAVEAALYNTDRKHRYDRGLYAGLVLELWHRAFLDR